MVRRRAGYRQLLQTRAYDPVARPRDFGRYDGRAPRGRVVYSLWTLLHSEADWRGMEARADSPWYPSMRLFRQERYDDWETVAARVASELETLTHVRRGTVSSSTRE